jgi:hypothetical protein
MTQIDSVQFCKRFDCRRPSSVAGQSMCHECPSVWCSSECKIADEENHAGFCRYQQPYICREVQDIPIKLIFGGGIIDKIRHSQTHIYYIQYNTIDHHASSVNAIPASDIFIGDNAELAPFQQAFNRLEPGQCMVGILFLPQRAMRWHVLALACHYPVPFFGMTTDEHEYSFHAIKDERADNKAIRVVVVQDGLPIFNHKHLPEIVAHFALTFEQLYE